VPHSIAEPPPQIASLEFHAHRTSHANLRSMHYYDTPFRAIDKIDLCRHFELHTLAINDYFFNNYDDLIAL
jgi:hypothetical protein